MADESEVIVAYKPEIPAGQDAPVVIKSLDEMLGAPLTPPEKQDTTPAPPEPEPFYKRYGFEKEEDLDTELRIAKDFRGLPKEVIAAYNKSETKDFDTFAAKLQEIRELSKEVKIDKSFDIYSDEAKEIYHAKQRKELGEDYDKDDADAMYDDLKANKTEEEVRKELKLANKELQKERKSALDEMLKSGEITKSEYKAATASAEEIAAQEEAKTKLLSENSDYIKQIVHDEKYAIIADYGDSKVSVYQPDEQGRSIIETGYNAFMKANIDSGAEVSPEMKKQAQEISEAIYIRSNIANIIVSERAKEKAIWEAKMQALEQTKTQQQIDMLGKGRNTNTTPAISPQNGDTPSKLMHKGVDLSKAWTPK